MDSMEKLWSQVDELKEHKTRHDERIKQLERNEKNMLEKFSSVSSELQGMREDFKQGFAQMAKRMTDYEAVVAETKGYRRAEKDLQMKFYKQLGIAVSIVGIAVGFITWWLSR